MRLAILLSHPVQYYSPWFRVMAGKEEVVLRVFYLWNSGVVETKDRTFGTTFAWDIPLLDGYESEFIPNLSKDPGTHCFSGLDNPEAVARISDWKPDALLLFGYAWKSHLRVLFSRRLKRVPKLYRGDSHNLYPQFGVRFAISRILKRVILRRFQQFLPVGGASRDYLVGLGVPESRITLVPHCVDNDRFRKQSSGQPEATKSWKAKWGIDEKRPMILFVGKWEMKKRPLDLLRAFLQARFTSETGVPVLVFVGDGALRESLQKEAGDRTNLDVFFVPFQNQSEMPEVYSAGNVLVLPSLGNGETWGLVVNEAMACGIPAIVSSQVGCGPDLVVPGETGWRFEAGNVEALQSSLEEALNEPDRLKQMGQKAQEHIDDFSYAVAARKLRKALGTLEDSLS